MFKYLTNLFKKKNPEEKKEESPTLDISHDDIKITPILPIGSPSPKLPKILVKPVIKSVVKPVIKPIVKPVSKLAPQTLSIKIKPKHKVCPQCTQKVNMTDTVCRFCLHKV